MKQAEWDSKQYLKFERERTQPPRDLASRITLNDPKKILDVGCGPGNSTNVLRERFPNADILGIDSSPDMIAKAEKQYPEMNFQFFNVEQPLAGLGGTFDVIFSNACIQWVPDHPRLLCDMLSVLNPGGVIAVQVPIQTDAPVHRILRALAVEPEWRNDFPEPRIFFSLSPEEYFDLFTELNADFSIWETIYYQTVHSHEEILEWYRGSGMRPYLAVLSDERKKQFEAAVLERIKANYPVQRDGDIIFRFPRLFFLLEKK